MGQTYKRKLVQRIFDNLTSFKQLFTEVKRAEQPKFVSVMTLVEKGQNFVVLACYACTSVSIKYHPRFFVQVEHDTTHSSIGNKHFFTRSCHRQTYHNYE